MFLWDASGQLACLKKLVTCELEQKPDGETQVWSKRSVWNLLVCMVPFPNLSFVLGCLPSYVSLPGSQGGLVAAPLKQGMQRECQSCPRPGTLSVLISDSCEWPTDPSPSLTVPLSEGTVEWGFKAKQRIKTYNWPCPMTASIMWHFLHLHKGIIDTLDLADVLQFIWFPQRYQKVSLVNWQCCAFLWTCSSS